MIENTATSASRPRSPADCIACGRYIGPVVECPYCGAEAAGRRAVVWLRRAALVFGIGGLAALYAASRHTELPVIRTEAIGPAMNYAQVRIRGTVATAPRVLDRQGAPDYASFEVDDGTGRVVVAASRRTARGLVSGNRLPARGDRVEVTGSLAIAPQRLPRLYLSSPAGMKRLEDPAETRTAHPAAKEET